MDYIELTIAVPWPQAEHAADVLRSLSGAGVWLELPFSQPDLESEALVDRDGLVVIHGYVGERDRGTVLQRAGEALAASGIDARVTQRTVAEEDWAEAWKAHFHVERYGRRVVVVPSWCEYAPAPDDAVVLLDPGMAFGTGQHETTRMCLEALERIVRPGMRVLDVGSGSGILSIAAAKLGAAEVLAVDIDEDCVHVTAENARLNAVDGRVRARRGSVGDAWPFEDVPPARGFDVVVANIITRVIIDVAAPLVEALAPGGMLVVSGVIGEREREAVAALETAGARVTSARSMGDWRCIEAAAAGTGEAGP